MILNDPTTLTVNAEAVLIIFGSVAAVAWIVAPPPHRIGRSARMFVVALLIVTVFALGCQGLYRH